jgi:hypothetical protein
VALHYSEFCVLCTFHFDSPGTLQPTVADLQNWDSLLKQTYENKLVQVMNQRGISLTRENKSRIVALAVLSNGKLPATRLRHACDFFVHTMSLPLAP